MFIELFLLILFYIILKDLQIIKQDMILIAKKLKSNQMLSKNDYDMLKNKPLFDPSHMMEMFQSTFQSLNNEIMSTQNNLLKIKKYDNVD